MEDLYKTIAVPAEGLYKEKGSKFISFAYPVQTEEQIKGIVAIRNGGLLFRVGAARL